MTFSFLRFDGNGYVAVDMSEYASVESEFVIKLKFRIAATEVGTTAEAAGNGILLLMGDSVDQDFVSLELQNSVLVYR